jgi:tripeptidyl-peptidase-1
MASVDGNSFAEVARFIMLLKLLLHLLAFGSAIALPAPEYNYVVHERRQSLHPRWEQSRKVARDNNIEITMRIALTQQNLHLSDDFLLEVSHPTSALFGHYWIPEKVAAAFAHLLDSVLTVTSWLVDAGVSPKDISCLKDGGWLNFNTSLKAAERLLQAQYHVYTNTFTSKRRVSCNSYSVPESVSTHINFITPTIQLIAKHKRRRSLEEEYFPGLKPEFGGYVDIHDNRLHDLANCDNFTTPDCIRALYRLPKGTTANPKNSYGIVELSPNIYAEIDLDLFFANFSPPLVSRLPKFASINSGPL